MDPTGHHRLCPVTTLVENIRLGQTGFAFILNNKGELQTTPNTRPTADITAGKIIYAEFLAKPPVSPGVVDVAIKSDLAKHENIYIADWGFRSAMG